MSSFHETKWSEADYAAGYLSVADLIIPQRPRFFELVTSFYRHFLGDGTARKVVELGCGDGAFTEALLKTGLPITATLIDGSEEMIASAKTRLAQYKDIKFVRSSFQELPALDIIENGADLIFSVLAIHHLGAEDKRALFELIYSQLAPGGFFLNIDDCLTSSSLIEGWHIERWRKEILQRAAECNVEIDPAVYIDQHNDHEHHKALETVEELCKTLKEVGFVGAECYFKDGIFTIYGGQKPDAK